MNGPKCNKLLLYADEFSEYLPSDLKMFGHALKSFDAFKQSCFGVIFEPDWKMKLEAFKEDYDKLGIGNFPKGHAAFDHIKEWCETNNTGLGQYSEHSFEGDEKLKKNQQSFNFSTLQFAI